MNRVLITGSSGLVGRAVVEALQQHHDWEIFAASSKSGLQDGERLHHIGNDCIERTLAEERINVLLHLAFPRNVKEDQWAAGMQFAAHVLGAARRHGVDKVINISSQSIYGWKRTDRAHEGDPVILTNPYTTGKYCSELMVNEMFADVPHTNVRLSTILGPTTAERVPNKFFAQIVAGKNLKVEGGGQTFSFLDVRDAADGLARLVVAEKPLRELYNLGTAEYATLIEIAGMTVRIAEKYGRTAAIELEEADIVLNNMLDVSAMQEDFGWTAARSLAESLEYIYVQNYVK